MTWMLCVLAFPIIGTLFYLFVKMQFGSRYMEHRLAKLRIETDPYLQQDPKVLEALWQVNPPMRSCPTICPRDLDFRRTGIQK